MSGSIPEFLTGLDRWVLWHEVSKGGRRTKLPISVRGGMVSDITDPKNWGSYAFCTAARARTPGAWDGEGVVLGDIGTGEILAGLDLDSCIEDDAVADWAAPFLAALNTYAEVSPSGHGLKLFFRVMRDELPDIRAMFSIADNMNGRKKTYPNPNGNGGGHGPAVELYLSDRYFTVTGQSWCDAPVALIGKNTIAAVAALFGPRDVARLSGDTIDDATAPAPEVLRSKLAAAMRQRAHFAERWMGDTKWLTDASRSGFDMSLGAMLKAAGLSYGEMRAALIANPHGAGAERADDTRYFERIWIRSVATGPPPEAEPPREPQDPNWWRSLEQSLLREQPTEEPNDDLLYERDAEENPPRPDTRDGLVIEPQIHWTAPAPLRRWLIDQWIPIGYVTGLYGDGGVGKSLLAQQLLTAVSVGLPWLGLTVKAGRSFGFMCEDDASELHRRQEGINRSYDILMENLENLRIAPRLGFDNLLMTFDVESRGTPSRIFAEICEYLDKYRPHLVVLDTLADIFGGNEINRTHARQFVQGIGGSIARRYDCAVVIPAHPSAAGLATGSGTSGSTAWNNTFRSRLYITRPADASDSDVRLISRMKSNYAPTGGEITAAWRDGAFVLETRPLQINGMTWEKIDEIFTEIDSRWREGEPYSSEPQTRNTGRFVGLCMEAKFGVDEKSVLKHVRSWLAGGYLKNDMASGHSKSRGLRVLRRLQPEIAL